MQENTRCFWALLGPGRRARDKNARAQNIIRRANRELVGNNRNNEHVRWEVTGFGGLVSFLLSILTRKGTGLALWFSLIVQSIYRQRHRGFTGLLLEPFETAVEGGFAVSQPISSQAAKCPLLQLTDLQPASPPSHTPKHKTFPTLRSSVFYIR